MTSGALVAERGNEVARVAVLLHGNGDTSMGPNVVADLADLGITSIALLRGEETVALVLEGWAFDASRSGDKAANIVAAGQPASILLPVMEMAISAIAREGRAL